jgi:hypothetical protein
MENDDHFTENMMTQSDHDRHEAMVFSEMKPDQAWILTDRDVWHRNPYYTGPAVPHPEDDCDEGANLTRQDVYLAQMPDFIGAGYQMIDAERAALSRLNE